MSIKLTDTQLVLLGAAAQRKDLCLVAPPTLKGATAQKVASKLISAGFVKEVMAKVSDPIWRRDDKTGVSYALKLTAAGAKEIAVDDAAEPDDAGEEGDALANRDQAAILSKLDAKDVRASEAMEPGATRPSAPRCGSKLARVIGLLERDHGATIALSRNRCPRRDSPSQLALRLVSWRLPQGLHRPATLKRSSPASSRSRSSRTCPTRR
jgi:hypothetical protein